MALLVCLVLVTASAAAQAARPFETLPARATAVRVLGRDRFRLTPGTLDVERVRSSWDTGKALTLATLDTLSAARGRTARTVVYPMAGFDAGVAARLFPEAETIVGLDDHTFLPDALPARLDVPHAPLQSAVYFRNVDALGHVGTAAIGQLRTTVPGFRLRGVTTFATDEASGERVDGRVRARGRATARHGIIEFDRGPGTAPQRYVHLQVPLARGVERSWWARELARNGIDGLIVKGAEDQLRQLDGLVDLVTGSLHERGGTSISDLRLGVPTRNIQIKGNFGYTSRIAFLGDFGDR